MNIQNGIVNIDNLGSIGIDLSNHSVQYREPSGTVINIPLAIILRAFAVAQTETTLQELDWDLVQKKILKNYVLLSDLK